MARGHTFSRGPSSKRFNLLIVSCFINCALICEGKLVYVFSLSRHGSRAPNKVVTRTCPTNWKNQQSYPVPFEELTDVGMVQMRDLGRHVRQKYIDELKFLPNSFSQGNRSGFTSFFRSDFANRCVQSATTMGYGLYPVGPGDFPSQPIPVFTRDPNDENIFAAPKAACKATLLVDIKKYGETRAVELLKKHKTLVKKVTDICSVPLEKLGEVHGSYDLALAIKDISDGFVFDRDEGLPAIEGITNNVRQDLKALAFQMLMERYYATNRMITYWCGGFPQDMLKSIDNAIQGKKSYLLASYHGHRELLFGFAMMLGWRFDFPGMPKALNCSEIPPATSMFFELHTHKNENDYYLKTFIWAPGMKDQIQVKLDKCSTMNCPLKEFRNIIEKHFDETGTWEEICYRTKKELNSKHITLNSLLKIILPIVGLLILSLLYKIYILNREKHKYSPIH